MDVFYYENESESGHNEMRSSVQRSSSSSSRHKGKRLTEEQVRLLEKSFSSDKKLDPERKLQLASELGVPPRQVAIWYQNKRARWKTQTLEMDYKALQAKLESALADKRELQRDMDRLRAELGKVQEMLLQPSLAPPVDPNHQKPQDLNNNNVVMISCCSNNNNNVSMSCEEGGGHASCSSNNSLINGCVSCCWEDQDQDHDQTQDQDQNQEDKKTLQLDDLYACVMFSSSPTRPDDIY